MRMWHVFVLCFTVRFIWTYLSGHDHLELNNDAGWIRGLADQTASGYVNYDIGRFIVSPLYPIIAAVFELLFGPWWIIALAFFQVALAAWSGVWLCRLALLVFNKETAFITVILFAFFPLTFWWTGTLATESVFQAFLIGAILFLARHVREASQSDLIWSATLFSLAYLTKSHILLFAPLLALYLWINRTGFRQGVADISIYAFVCLSFSLPYGYHTLHTQGIYVISSNGGPFHFYTGNSEFGYRSIVAVPAQGTEAFGAMQNFDLAYFNGEVHNSLISLPQVSKQKWFLEESLNWISNNPGKWLQLKLYNLGFFLLPGVSFRHYPLVAWAGTFIISLPVYFFAYRELWGLRKRRQKIHAWFVYLFFVMMFFSVFFYVQNRFRTITLEPFYLLFAAEGIRKMMTRQKTESFTNRGGSAPL
jgi:hypothetical protein